ncbi:MAG: nucleoside 2-deoxyribosyltransferase [Candidatus Thiodiazotropha sp. (ex Semelilucina semeliformis)]|nr:nucleoside 2-deoxyribosyltransferase [Candidatus Thiodiazotropha sp. (ex Semelilucina semeliformis)]
MPTVSDQPCPICKLEAKDVRVWDYGERTTLECERCGKFAITRTAAAMAKSRQLEPMLSAWIRERFETTAEIPEINSKTLEEVAKTLPNYKVAEKQLLLLRAIERRTAFPGQAIDIHPVFDFPLAWAAGEEEFLYLLRSLIERELVRRTDSSSDLNDSFVFMVEITSSGWDFLDQHSRPSILSDQAFVAMSFSSELETAWENAIKPALVKARFRPYRVDAKPHIDRIDTKIVSEIKNSKFLVADVTQQRPGVYFEAGYAIGLGIPVFWSVRADDLPNVHFDTRQYNHIVWNNENELSEQLYFFVSAIIGTGTAI